MKKWVSVFLLSLFLVSTTELYQLLKIPIFIEHFAAHQEQNSEMTVIDFLKIHYHHPKKDADYKTDRQLPFVSHNIHFTSHFTIQSVFFFDLKKMKLIKSKANIFSTRENDYVFNNSNVIWQPPKQTY